MFFTMRKFYIFTLIAIGLVVGTAAVSFLSLDQNTEVVPQVDSLPDLEDRTLIKAVLEAPDLAYSVSMPEGSTAYDLMATAAAQHNDFSFKGKEFSGLGFFVEEINGLPQDKEKGFYWIYYINGEKAPVGISQYKLKANDIITWKYEKEH